MDLQRLFISSCRFFFNKPRFGHNINELWSSLLICGSICFQDRSIWLRLDYQIEDEERRIVKKETGCDDDRAIAVQIARKSPILGMKHSFDSI